MTAVRTSPAAPPSDVVVALDDPIASDPARAGGKAAALARARRAGLPTLPGAVITTALSQRVDDGGDPTALAELQRVLELTAPDGAPLVVRSSSVVEDQSTSSRAGQFESVLDVRGPDQLRDAVEAVLRSRIRAGAADQPIAVLVQPMVEPEVAGVYFGVDPVTGRSDRRVVAAVAGQPDRLVSGEVDGSRWVVARGGRVDEADVRDGVDLSRARLRAIDAMGDRLRDTFDGPQDIEWAIVDDELVVLQSRPVTTHVRGVPQGPVYGPGPVAETFPEPLAQLEEDLWVPPLREGVRAALQLSGAVSERALADRELVITVAGRVALDLEITGELHERHGIGHRIAARARHLGAAWRIGRLRATLPHLADHLVAQVDTDLEQVPPLDELTTRQLVSLIARGREGLRSLHAHEILMGLVADPSTSHFTGASVALRILTESRREGRSDEEILRHAPVVLALVPPRIGAPIALPEASSAGGLAYDPPTAADSQVRREALRLRVRWMQELVAQAASEIGRRLTDRGVLARPGQVRHLRFEELSAVVAGQATTDPDLLESAERDPAPSPALPAHFRMSDQGEPISVHPEGRASGGTGAGGGRGTGPVSHDLEDPPEGAVLVVGALVPAIGPKLGRLAGIVSESGSVLSHLAILAREVGVATVVGHRGALAELPEGTVVTVDGSAGTIEVEEAP